LRRYLPPVVLACIILFLVGRTAIGLGGAEDGGQIAAFWIQALGLGLVGAILAMRRPDNPVGWLLLAFGFFDGLTDILQALAVSSTAGGNRSMAFSQNILTLAGWSFAISLATLALLFLMFPTGRLISSKWRRAVWLVGISIPISAFSIFVVSRSVLDIEDFLNNEWALEHAGQPVDELTSAVFSFGLGLQMVAILVGVAALVIRLRRSSGAERQQLKWVTFTFAVWALLSLIFLLNNQVDVPRLLVSVATVSSALVLPAGLAISLFRYRLYDIDRAISRTVSYGVLVGLLAGIFFGAVALLTLVLPTQDNLAIAASTLAIAALFAPLRQRVRTVVDRRFNRSRYDTQLVIDQFASSLRDRVDLQGLVDDWLSVVEETMQPSATGVWIKDQRMDK
jgi:hypothetical protein